VVTLDKRLNQPSPKIVNVPGSVDHNANFHGKLRLGNTFKQLVVSTEYSCPVGLAILGKRKFNLNNVQKVGSLPTNYTANFEPKRMRSEKSKGQVAVYGGWERNKTRCFAGFAQKNEARKI
jgi:hypothetical protein